MALELKESNLFCPTRARVLRCAPQSHMDVQRHTPGHQLPGMSLQLKGSVVISGLREVAGKLCSLPCLLVPSAPIVTENYMLLDKHMTQGPHQFSSFIPICPHKIKILTILSYIFPFASFPMKRESPYQQTFKGRISVILLCHLALWMPPHLI